MKLLITGGAGFIGSELVRQAVKHGYKVVVVDRLTYAGDMERLHEIIELIKFYREDITDTKAVDHIFESENPDIIVHLAAETHVDRSILEPSVFLNSNIIGTYTLLEAAKKYGIKKFINISTDEVYGELKEEGQFTEQSPLSPNSPYSVSKASADMLGRAYYRTYGVPVITVRPSNNYGPWQYPEKLIPVIMLKSLKNESIPVYGEGLNVREWLYVGDCAEALISIIQKGRIGEIYNVASAQERKNIEVVKAVLDILDKPHRLIKFVEDRPGHDFRYSMNFSKVMKECGWKPETTFEQGIEKTVKWYLEHKDWLYKKVAELEDYWAKLYK